MTPDLIMYYYLFSQLFQRFCCITSWYFLFIWGWFCFFSNLTKCHKFKTDFTFKKWFQKGWWNDNKTILVDISVVRVNNSSFQIDIETNSLAGKCNACNRSDFLSICQTKTIFWHFGLYLPVFIKNIGQCDYYHTWMANNIAQCVVQNLATHFPL